MRAVAMLVKGGLSFAEIDELDEAEFLSWAICFGEIEGGTWDWETMGWEKKT